MSAPIQGKPTAAAEFQAHFGTAPGSENARADCEKWEKLCGELLQERARLQAELAKVQAQVEADAKALCKVLAEVPPFELTMEEAFALVDKETTMDQLIAELEREAEKP
jgi:hypothetical protein